MGHRFVLEPLAIKEQCCCFPVGNSAILRLSPSAPLSAVGTLLLLRLTRVGVRKPNRQRGDSGSSAASVTVV